MTLNELPMAFCPESRVLIVPLSADGQDPLLLLMVSGIGFGFEKIPEVSRHHANFRQPAIQEKIEVVIDGRRDIADHCSIGKRPVWMVVNERSPSEFGLFLLRDSNLAGIARFIEDLVALAVVGHRVFDSRRRNLVFCLP